MKPELLEEAFKKNTVPVALISENRHLVCNDAYSGLFAYETEEILGIPFLQLFSQKQIPPLKEFLLTLKSENKDNFFYRTTGITKKGTELSIELSISYFESETDYSELYLIAARDNYELIKMEQELQKSRNSLYLIKECHKIFLSEETEQGFLDRICSKISHMENYTMTWYSLKKDDGNLCTGSFQKGSKQLGARRSLYLSSRAMNSEKTLIYNNPEEFPEEEEEKNLLISDGCRSIIVLPLTIHEETCGTINIYSQQNNCFYGDRENLESLVEDISYGLHSIRLKRKQNDLEKQLHHAQKMETIGTLAGGIAHDFNNIMTPILCYSEMILSQIKPDNPYYVYNQQIFNGAIRAKELVKQILTFSHKGDHKKEPIFVDKIVKEALQLMSSLIPKTISIYKHISRQCGKILGDSAQIHQVIANLCTNSFQAMEIRGGTLTVDLKPVTVDLEMKRHYPELKPGKYAQLIIADTGTGMSEETKKRLFEPFYTTKPVGKGTGLGLSVVHGIISNHGGTIHVESHEGMGTLFRILLPLINQDADSPQLLEETDSIILLIDDHRDITELLKIMLINCGYSVISFNRTVDALSFFNNDPSQISMVITDLIMPEIRGIDLLKAFKEKRDDLPAIVITGQEENLTVQEKKNYNIREVIQKPILRNTFIDAVRKSLAEANR